MAGLPKPMAKLVVAGTLAQGVQDCSFGIWFDPAFSDIVTQEILDTTLADMSTLTVAFLSDGNVSKMMCATDQWTALKLYYYPTSSLVATLVSEQTLTPIVGSGTANHPKETSLVASLRSAVPGRSGRGRFYYPASGVDMSADGVLASSTTVDNFGIAIGTWLNGLNDVNISPVVASFSKSQIHPVVKAVVDNKPDTQRRRQDKVAATHTFTQTISG